MQRHYFTTAVLTVAELLTGVYSFDFLNGQYCQTNVAAA